jgi:hypothetical protein
MQPLGTVMSSNICHEIGMYEKQVSCYFEAVSGQASVVQNIFYNMPRAAINFNVRQGFFVCALTCVDGIGPIYLSKGD